MPDESTCQVFCVVAWNWPWYRGEGKALWYVYPRCIIPLRQFPCYCGIGRLNLGREFMLIMLRWKVNDFYCWLMTILNGWKFSANATIEVSRALFSWYGLPLALSSDNDPQFVAGEFQTFLKMNCIKHTLCPPYHPSTTGLAERHGEFSKGCTGLVLTKGHFSTTAQDG